MAKREGLLFLGRLPVDTELVTLLDASEAQIQDDIPKIQESFQLLLRYQKTTSAKLFKDILGRIMKALSDSDLSQRPSSAATLPQPYSYLHRGTNSGYRN
jgi:hypothetical protein